jgi:flagellin
MSDIVLSASVRQNLLSLQSTAELLATTQNRLSTGNKVNSALDNPTNYFTSQSLNSRASDISNLLDGISNGVQVLQAANTGITSLQKLVDSAKSVANQALQATSGYTTKSLATTAAVTGATASNLLGTPAAFVSAAVTATAAKLNDNTTAANITGSTLLSGTASGTSDDLASNITTSDTIVVNGTTISFVASGATGNQLNVTDSVGTLLSKIDSLSGGTGAAVSGGKVTLNSGTTSDLTISGTGLAKIGLVAGTTARTGGTTALGGTTLNIAATGGGTATAITFGTTGSQISTLDQLNTALAANNLTASIDTTGALTFTTTNDHNSDTIGAFSGSSVAAGKLGATVSVSGPVADTNAQNSRASLVTQYNNIIQQITTTAQDASFNGINLLNGDQLKLVFNETGRSTLNIAGVTDDPAGLGLTALTSGADFVDNAATNKVLTALDTATSTLRGQASTLGSNLSIVQIRQDFSKSLINVLQTGASNLTLADTNEEAANSQALSTRQSIAVSALSLANQSQQSVLKLLQ